MFKSILHSLWLSFLIALFAIYTLFDKELAVQAWLLISKTYNAIRKEKIKKQVDNLHK